jgi:uncharacterized membrane protein
MSRKTKRNLPVTYEQRTVLQQITYEAPLPPPRMLEQYEHVLPGSAARLIKRMEAQSEHRHGLENVKLTRTSRAKRAGKFLHSYYPA